jgi:hypothetical protein
VSEGNGAGPEIRDFTPERKPPIRFRIHDEVYEAAPELPGGTLLDFATLAEQFDGAAEQGDAAKVGLLVDLFDKVLLPASAELFKTRMRDLERPITIGVVPDILNWLFSEYTGRPLAPSAASSDGPEANGGSSTADAPSQGSILAGSPPTASST